MEFNKRKYFRGTFDPFWREGFTGGFLDFSNTETTRGEASERLAACRPGDSRLIVLATRGLSFRQY